MRIKIFERLGEQLVPKDGAQMASHDRLLLHRAVVLQGQDQRVRRCLGERFHSARGQNRWIIQRYIYIITDTQLRVTKTNKEYRTDALYFSSDP